MSYIDKRCVVALFEVLAESGLEWLLLRNTEDELPSRLVVGKDIDVIMHYDDRDLVRDRLSKSDYVQIRHPLAADVRLYGVHPFEMFRSECGLLLDINYEIAVRSLDKGQWVPLDQAIQKEVWTSLKRVELTGHSVLMPSTEVLFVITLARCIFDKRGFSPWHREKLHAWFLKADKELIIEMLRLVFFKYSDRLLQDVENARFDSIVHDHLSFSEY